MALLRKLRGAWNAFVKDETAGYSTAIGIGTGSRPDRVRFGYFAEKTIITSIYTRMSIDVAAVELRHALLDERGRYKEDKKSSLSLALNLEANTDQAPSAFRQDLAMTLFDEGAAAIVPVDASIDPETGEQFDIFTLRVGKIVGWYPKHLRVRLYNEARGEKQDILLEKRFVAVVENPLYAVMNEPNSTLQRLTRKLTLLDAVDEQSSSGKLDIIIQLPYVIKSEARKQQAQARREDIEFQLKGSQYGIAYTDATEKITQLNRPTENNLLNQVEYLTKMLYGQLGITEEIMNGTADEAAMINYYNRSIEPIIRATAEAMQRSFLGPMGTANGERIMYFKDSFKLAPISVIAEIADKFTRNEIMSSNEIRGVIGLPPSSDPKADRLVNSNMPQGSTSDGTPSEGGLTVEDMDQVMTEVFDGLAADIDKIGGGA